jgi:ABC-type glutathione transport system ATPase component
MTATQDGPLNGARRHPPAISLVGVSVTYRSGVSTRHTTEALRGVSLDVLPGETVGLVGESGSGKTTLGRVALGLIRPTNGHVMFGGRPDDRRRARRKLRGRRQVVLQNPDWSLNPALRVWRSVAEPLTVTRSANRRDRRHTAEEMLTTVGLDPSLGNRRPHELSGGQRQRVAIARALITGPELIVFDEAVTALDASVQIQVLNLIRDLQARHGFAALFISHDIAAVRYVAHRVAVVYRGELVETGPVELFYGAPSHPHSRHLVSAMTSIHDLVG